MTGVALSSDAISAAFLAACRAELQALKPGNVHVHAPGHGMEVAQFETAAMAAAPFISDPALSAGQRILKATQASFAAAHCNTNLGIVLLCAPLAKAAAETDPGMGLRRRLALILSGLTIEDAANTFEAILIANPAGLGSADKGDVRAPASMTLIEAMHEAASRDRIANAYVTAFSDIFDFALPALTEARANTPTPELAISALHMALLAEFPDSHISRKFGGQTATAVQHEARALHSILNPADAANTLAHLSDFDKNLKRRGLNPGTTADFVVATLFTEALSARKQK